MHTLLLLMNKVPDIVGFRHNLQSWAQDQGHLKDAAAEFAAQIADPDNYEAFMQAFLGKQRTDSGFAFETLGNPRSDGLPEDALLSLNTVDDSTLEKGYLTANGVKVDLDSEGKEVFLHLRSAEEPVTVKNLLTHTEKGKEAEIRKLVENLSKLDILEIKV